MDTPKNPDALRASFQSDEQYQAACAPAVPVAAVLPATDPAAMWTYTVSPPQGFIDYVAKNYNGDVNFHDPEWHALRLWNAAMRNAQPPAVNLEALRNVRRMLDGSQPKDIPGAIMAIDALLATPAPALPVVPEGWVPLPTEINAILEVGFAYLGAAREATPNQKWSFSHAGYHAMLAKAEAMFKGAAAPAAPAGFDERESFIWALGYRAGKETPAAEPAAPEGMVDIDEVKQLCRDFSSRTGNVYIKDVEAALDGLAAAPVLSAEQPSDKPQDQSGSIRPSAEPAGQHGARCMVAQPLLYARLMEMSEILRAGIRWNGNEHEFADKTESDVAMLDDILGDALRLAAEPPVEQSSIAGAAKGGITSESIHRIYPHHLDNSIEELEALLETDCDERLTSGQGESIALVVKACKRLIAHVDSQPEFSQAASAEPDTATQDEIPVTVSIYGSVEECEKEHARRATQAASPIESIDTVEFRNLLSLLSCTTGSDNFNAERKVIEFVHSWHQRATQAAKPLTDDRHRPKDRALTDKQKENIERAAEFAKRNGNGQLADSLRGILSHLKGEGK